MKKLISTLIVLILFLYNFSVPSAIRAETLGDLKNKLNQKQQEYTDSENKKVLTQKEINQTNSDIAVTKKNIEQTYIDINSLQKDIDDLYEKISAKKAEVKKIINFVQVSNGVSSYLEYIFGAESFTDLIYRAAVAEQMSSYNEKLVKEYNQLIEDSKKKQEEISNKQVELGKYQKDLEQKVASLGKELEEEKSTSISIADEIKTQKEIIEMYEQMGCKDNENIKTCGRALLPAGTAFYRPTQTGHVTSEWGVRYLIGNWHEGIDIGVPEGTTVYSVATGVVASVLPRTSCGGNMVVAHHKINGQTYTSVYAHLLSINVSKGEVINRNTIIGYSGGGSTASYDNCTFGAHLHLTIALGQYGVDYTNWSYQLNRVYSRNPRDYINFPSGRNSWSDRLTAY